MKLTLNDLTVNPSGLDRIDIVLQEFREALIQNLEHPWEHKHGQPPKYGYIEHREFAKDVLRMGKAISAWYISKNSIKPISLKEQEVPFEIDGMFYSLFKGHFCFTPDLSLVFINWQTGPRFGRGFKHRIGIDTLGNYLLDKGSSTWVS